MHLQYFKLLQSTGRPHHWLLKGPTHLPVLPALFDAYPDAKLALMLRDPVKSAASVVDVSGVLYYMRSDNTTLGKGFGRSIDGKQSYQTLQNMIDWMEDGVIPKVVRGLLGHRKAGRWSTTQENAFVLLALDRYFRVYESQTPDFVARAWLGDDYAGEHAFRGRTTEQARIDIPMAQLTDPPGRRDLILAKDGPGRLYYRLGLRYAPKSLTMEPADHGFEVARSYAPVDDPSYVQRDADGTWRIRAGARVRVRLSMVTTSRRTHVALVDPLPAGLEPMNPELAVTGQIPADPTAEADAYWWWRGAWYEHQNMRDERVEAFTTLLYPGVYEYTYVTLATTPGQFVVPPTKAEEMYHPETFGRGGSDRMTIE